MNPVQISTTLAPIISFVAGLLASRQVFGWDAGVWATVIGSPACGRCNDLERCHDDQDFTDHDGGKCARSCLCEADGGSVRSVEGQHPIECDVSHDMGRTGARAS